MQQGIDPAVMHAALEHVRDAVLIVGPGQAVLHANTAAADLLGRAIDDLIGAHILLILPIEGSVQSMDPVLDRFATDGSWSGHFAQRRPDGSVVDIDAQAWPWGDVDRTQTAIVVLRPAAAPDPRAAELAMHVEHREAVLSVMGAVRPEPTVEETTIALCASVAEINGIDGAMIVVKAHDSDIVHMGSVGPELPGFEVGSSVPTDNVETVIAMSAAGPWWLDITSDDTGALIGMPLLESLRAEGVTATGYAALRDGDEVTGVLCVASLAPDGPSRMPAMLPLVEQLAGFSATVLAKQASLFGEEAASRHRVQRVLDEGLFSTVLQPVVSLATGQVMGYEALTRFHDERAPDLWVGDAHAVGLGLALEEACANSAVRAASDLDADMWLCVNFSPEAIVGGSIMRSVTDASRRIVVEVTEHTQVASYAAIRDEMKRYPGIDVSIDDAGAGFAGLRHIVELDPTFVKLDISMVHDVDKDPSRAAMVAGMCHFARATGTRLVAEGIETEEEAQTLRALGVDLGQGYLFGRPVTPQ